MSSPAQVARGMICRVSELFVRPLTPTRWKLALLLPLLLLVALPSRLSAQDDTGDTPLGDVARSFRKNTASSETVIDNDNFSRFMDGAEDRRAAGSSLLFSLVPGEKSFHVSSPDVTCSLSFSAKTASLLSEPLLDELPRSELAKLDGPATIDGDSLQVSMHNGTMWDLREVVIGLTIVKRLEPGQTASYFGQAQMVPALAGITPQVQDAVQKQPDVTLLLRVKGSAAPSATAIFRTPLNFALFPDQEWHWAIVKAKGVPPQASPAAEAAMTEPEPRVGQLPPAPPETGTPLPQPIPFPADPDAATH
jgi:hypothetical protein